MRKLVLLIAAGAGAAAAQPADREPARCGGSERETVADRRAGRPGARPLNEMPDARPILAVQREVDGCRVLLVREGGRIIEEPVGRPERRRVFVP